MPKNLQTPENGVGIYINDYSKHDHNPKYKLVLNTPDNDGETMKTLERILADLGLENKSNSWARIDLDWKTPEAAHAQIDALLTARQKELSKGNWAETSSNRGEQGTASRQKIRTV